MALTFYEVTHFERPDTSYPDYDDYFRDDEENLYADDDMDEDDMYFGYGDFDEEYEVYDDQKLRAVVDEYCGAKADNVVDDYWKMGPLDPAYMDAVRSRWEVMA